MQIGILGSWDKDLPAEVYEMAERIGRGVAEHGDVLVTGGSTGIMEAAMRGAKAASGISVGIIPTDDTAGYDAIGKHADLHIATGMGEFGKLALLINSVQAVIAIAGGAGTLIEITMAYAQNKPLVCVPVPGYTTDRIRNMLIDGSFLDHRRIRRLHFAGSASDALDRLYKLLDADQPESR